MSMNIRYPNISAPTEREQIAQIKSYLRQLVDQLNFELNKLDAMPSYTTQQQIQNQNEYLKKSGYGANRILVTDGSGNVVARKLTISQDENGNIYYKLEG